MKDRHWTSLVTSLRHGQCLLVLGSEIPVAFAGSTAGSGDTETILADALTSKLRTELEEDDRRVTGNTLAAVAQQYEDAEGFGANAMRAVAEKFYKSPDYGPSDVHRALAALPFSLILTTSQDPLFAAALNAAAKKPLIQRYHLRGDKRANPEFVVPGSPDAPVLYHLFGDAQEPASLVLSENDLLDFLIAIVSERPPLPNSLIRALKRQGQNFLFLGFGIKQWYLRVLLKIIIRTLELHRTANAIATEPLRGLSDTDREQTCIFYQRGTRIEIEDQDIATFLAELTRRLEGEGGFAGRLTPLGPRPRVLISYASEDGALAARVCNSLQDAHFEPWLDKESLVGGDAWDERIKEELALTDFTLVLYTPALCRKTDSYVNKEIALARQRALSVRGSFLIPLRTAEIADDDRVAELAQYQEMPLRPGAIRRRPRQSGVDNASRLPAAQQVMAVNERRTRYPGAQPFVDDAVSRRMFFGRDEASKSLTDQILANQIVVIYAKSGLGKTSLLNAGVAPRLRDEDYLPLSVRVNDISRGPLVSVLDGVKAEAQRQHVEYTDGQRDSLWSFFKTAEFWRGDLLMTPVLILDQFEELFTLHGAEARDSFLSELSFLVRGVNPLADRSGEPLTEGTPPIRIVLSLREDHLGLLEEGADHLPQILDHRFRLTPLTLNAAVAAMTRPAEIDDPVLETQPFRFDPGAVDQVLRYLSRHRRRSPAAAARYVEPFQLQLVCQRVERVVAERQKRQHSMLTITMKDIGGEAALRETLQDFYTTAVRSLPTRKVRRAVRRLCEEFLISPEGRRLSLEENEIERQLEISPKTLQMLVANRLLRSDHRSDSAYYELSHDALLEPVLATRRRAALLFGWLGLIIASSAAVLVLTTGVAGLAMTTDEDFAGVVIVEVLLIPLLIVLVGMSRRSLRSLRRYRHRTRRELEAAIPAVRTRTGVLLGTGSILAGTALVLVGFFAGVTLLNAVSGGTVWIETDPFFMEVQRSVAEKGIGFDTAGLLVSIPFVMSFGVRALRWGARKLVQAPTVADVDGMDATPGGFMRFVASPRPRLILATIGFVAAVVLSAAAAFLYFCAWNFQVPGWIYASTNTLVFDCEQAKAKGFVAWEVIAGWVYIAVLVAESVRLLAGRKVTMQSHARHEVTLA